MKGSGIWCMPQRVAAVWSRQMLCPGNILNRGACTVLGFTGLALLASGCATDKGALSSASAGGDSTEPQPCRFGTVALLQEFTPATFSYQKAKGKRGSVKQAFIDS